MEREPAERRLRVHDTELALFEWSGADPPTLFVHATGFHARCWDGVIRELPDLHALALDLRAHGRSPQHPPYTWASFAADVVESIRALDLRDLVGVGHSMGGYCVAYAAALEPERFRSLVLIDPVILDPAQLGLRAGGHPASEGVRRRKNRFASPEAMLERFRERPPYASWREDVLWDYCRHGLVPAADGDGYTLACPPDVEAQIYENSGGQDIAPLLSRIVAPATVLRARQRESAAPIPDFSASPTWPALASQLPRGRDVYLPERSHFMPMEVPELVARHVSEAREPVRGQ